MIFDKQAAQGDVCFTRIDKLPKGLTEVKPEGTNLIVTHSETGHHHVMDPAKATMFTDNNDPFIAFLNVKEETSIKHLRGHDTHEEITFKPGNYRVNRQREGELEGYRRVAD